MYTFEAASSSISDILIVFSECWDADAADVDSNDLITAYTWSVVLTGL